MSLIFLWSNTCVYHLDDGTLLPDPTSYRQLVRRLIYLTVTRPDINYSVNILSQFMHSPRMAHMDSAHCVVRYLKGSIGKEIFLSSSLLLGDPLQAIVFFLVPILFLGKLRNRLQFLNLLLKLNIEPWLL
jgi:hypothetical protein